MIKDLKEPSVAFPCVLMPCTACCVLLCFVYSLVSQAVRFVLFCVLCFTIWLTVFAARTGGLEVEGGGGRISSSIKSARTTERWSRVPCRVERSRGEKMADDAAGSQAKSPHELNLTPLHEEEQRMNSNKRYVGNEYVYKRYIHKEA